MLPKEKGRLLGRVVRSLIENAIGRCQRRLSFISFEEGSKPRAKQRAKKELNGERKDECFSNYLFRFGESLGGIVLLSAKTFIRACYSRTRTPH